MLNKQLTIRNIDKHNIKPTAATATTITKVSGSFDYYNYNQRLEMNASCFLYITLIFCVLRNITALVHVGTYIHISFKTTHSENKMEKENGEGT